MFLTLSGFTFVVNADYRLRVNDIPEIEDVSEYYIARLYESPSHREKTLKVTLNVLAYKSGNSLQNIDSKVIAYFEKSEKSTTLKYGDCIILFADPEEVEVNLAAAESTAPLSAEEQEKPYYGYSKTSFFIVSIFKTYIYFPSSLHYFTLFILLVNINFY